jgi:hypothetical protein
MKKSFNRTSFNQELNDLLEYIAHIDGHGFNEAERRTPRSNTLLIYFGQVSELLKRAENLGILSQQKLREKGNWKDKPEEITGEMLRAAFGHARNQVFRHVHSLNKRTKEEAPVLTPQV